MRLQVFVPSRTYAFYGVTLVDVETEDGRLGLLPRHIDCVAALAPGLVMYRDADDGEHYLGTDGGTLVKIGDRVLVSTPRAVVGRELGTIYGELEARRREREAQAKEAQKALARLEVQLARSVFERESSFERS